MHLVCQPLFQSVVLPEHTSVGEVYPVRGGVCQPFVPFGDFRLQTGYPLLHSGHGPLRLADGAFELLLLLVIHLLFLRLRGFRSLRNR